MRLNRIFFGGILVLFGIIAISGCRHTRPTNTGKHPAPAPTHESTATSPSAQSVMTHADSALARISQLKSEDIDAETAPRAEMPSGQM